MREGRAPLPVSVAFWDYDRTMPIADGRIAIEGCAPTCTILHPADTFRRAFATAEFDICELSVSRHAQAVAAGTSRYLGLPIFPSRAFRHASLYVRSSLPVATPRDMAGQRIGLNNYDDTAAVVVRGFLRDQYGLTASDIVWVVGDMEASNRPRLVPPPLYADIPVETLPSGQTLNDELEAERLDGVIALMPPRRFLSQPPSLRRLFPDWRAAERDYFRATGVFPIMHLVGVRAELAAAHPWLASSVVAAFEQAKALAIDNLGVLQACKVTLPWATADLHATRDEMGDDYWPYGLEANRVALTTALRHLREDGLLPRDLAPDALFAPPA